MRQQLGDSWLGATPKCESTSQKKGSSGTRIPASSASAYKQMEPAGGGEHARRSPAGIGVNAFVLTPNFSQRAWTDFWLRRYEATRSVAGHERAFPPPPPSSSRSLESAVVSEVSSSSRSRTKVRFDGAMADILAKQPCALGPTGDGAATHAGAVGGRVAGDGDELAADGDEVAGEGMSSLRTGTRSPGMGTSSPMEEAGLGHGGARPE